MRNIIKFSVALLVAITLYSFSTTQKFEANTKTTTSVSLDTLTWKLLSNIDYQKKASKVYGEVMFPVINAKLKAMQGKPVVITGFIIPIDSKSFAVSKNVFANCFFCGKSGPESIMGIQFKGTTPKLKTDQYVTLKGTFRYNDNDVEDWIYHVENAVIVSGN
jgi:hypothetical protein